MENKTPPSEIIETMREKFREYIGGQLSEKDFKTSVHSYSQKLKEARKSAAGDR
jgi:hypothetical protein